MTKTKKKTRQGNGVIRPRPQFARLALVLIAGVVAVIVGWRFESPKVLLKAPGGDSMVINSTVPTTKSFVTHGQWTLTYTYNCIIPKSNSTYGDGFGAVVMNPGGQSDKTDAGKDVNVTGSKGGATVTFDDSGRHSLAIISYCPWTIVVKG